MSTLPYSHEVIRPEDQRSIIIEIRFKTQAWRNRLKELDKEEFDVGLARLGDWIQERFVCVERVMTGYEIITDLGDPFVRATFK